MVNSAPEVIGLAVDLHEHLVQMPLPLRQELHPRPQLASEFGREHRAKPVPPEPDRSERAGSGHPPTMGRRTPRLKRVSSDRAFPSSANGACCRRTFPPYHLDVTADQIADVSRADVQILLRCGTLGQGACL